MAKQTTSHILMIRPTNFNYNEITATNNYYQKMVDGLSLEGAQKRALEEFDDFVDKLKGAGIDIIVIDDTKEPKKPDSVFPNNWVSFHQDGDVGLYPMFAPNRRIERRVDIIEQLREQYDFNIRTVKDFSAWESEQLFLEGTGSLLLDRVNKIAYAAISPRTSREALNRFCDQMGYQALPFHAYQTVGEERLLIYHTNVMMCLGEEFAVICLDSIDDPSEKQMVIDALISSGREIIDISEEQVAHFAGNMLQVGNENGDSFTLMSSAAFQSLDKNQVAAIEKYTAIIHSSLDMIEAYGGGSARCMMAEVFLPRN